MIRIRLTATAWLSWALVAIASQPPLDIPDHACSLADREGWPPSMLQVCPATLEPPPISPPPWTEEPSCVQVYNDTGVFCLFTISTFANGRGISLFTTPFVAYHIAEHSAAFTNPEILDGVNDISDPPYVSQPLPGRGIGLIANRTLHRGDQIFSHTPVLVIHREAFEALAEVDRFPYQHDAINLLPERSRDLFLALHPQLDGDNVDSIIHTNSFQVPLGEGKAEYHNVVLPETSRLNHDCRPNAHYYFDANTMTHYVHAIRTIHAGEELTISYTDSTATRATRQAAIKLSWGFDCSCSLCTQRDIFTQESDKRLELISDLEKHLDDWSEESAATPEMAETNISLYEQERLHAPIALAYVYAALTYNAVGQAHAAIKYAALAVEAGLLTWGPADPDVLSARELMEDPKAHWSWNFRKESRVPPEGDLFNLRPPNSSTSYPTPDCITML